VALLTSTPPVQRLTPQELMMLWAEDAGPVGRSGRTWN
jgi:hypothetical protein